MEEAETAWVVGLPSIRPGRPKSTHIGNRSHGWGSYRERAEQRNDKDGETTTHFGDLLCCPVVAVDDNYAAPVSMKCLRNLVAATRPSVTRPFSFVPW
jgi:hypothetical protein